MTDYRVLIENMGRSYGDKTVLNGVNLRVRPGEFVTIVGPSGCGKSTFLRLLLGAEQPDKGCLLVDGAPKLEPDRECGIVYQKYSLFPQLRILENVALGLIMENSGIPDRMVDFVARKIGVRYGFAKKEKEYLAMAQAFLERVGLNDFSDKYPFQLSGGMQQRVAIVQALIVEPKVLLLDEPFSALDAWTRSQLQRFLLELWQKTNMTVFFVTHDLEEAIYLGTRIVVLAPYSANVNAKSEGAKIVADLAISSQHIRPPEFKTSEMLNAILRRITQLAFDGEKTHNHDDLILEHPDCASALSI